MSYPSALRKVERFFITRIAIGILVILGLIGIIEWLGRVGLKDTGLSEIFVNLMIALAEAAFVIWGYSFLYRQWEKRKISELKAGNFGKYALIGLLTGLLLQSLFVFALFLNGNYSVERLNSPAALLSSLAFAVQAGFVAEILFVGVAFRLLEKEIGTRASLAVFVILFVIFHWNAKGASAITVGAAALQAGFLLPAAYIFSRSLWLPIFIHLGWDFAEPGIFGAANPSTSLTESWLHSKLSGPVLLTGGQAGPQSSVQALIFCLLTGTVFLILASRKGTIMYPNRLNFFKKARSRNISR